VKNILQVLVCVVALLLYASRPVVAGQKINGEVSIFGITLGKSLNEAGIKECNRNNDIRLKGSGIITYKEVQESICWERITDRSDFKAGLMRLDSKSIADIFYCGKCIGLQVIYLEKAKEDDLPSIPISEIQMGFPYEMSDQFLKLVVNKFGKPHNIEKSVLKNKMGAKFDNETYYWNVGKHKLVLRRRYIEVEAGLFTATHYDKWSKDAGEYSKKMRETEKKF